VSTITRDAGAECKVCSRPFLRLNSLQTVCGVRCATKVPAIAKRTERLQDAIKREALKTRKELTQEAQQAFNAYIRLRDAGRPCICCGSAFEPQKLGGSADAGHYLSIGAAPNLRFDEANVHAQRKNCNRPGGTTRAAFRAGMIARVGPAEVERLEADQAPRKFSPDELRALRALYREKAKALKQVAQPQLALLSEAA
jgi:hypothetical protein